MRLLRLYVSIKNFIVGLPIIRDVPAFGTLPPNITHKNLRFYKLNNLVLTLGMAVHGMWVMVFFYSDIKSIMPLNVGSLLVYIFNIYINRKGYYFTSTTMMVLEIITFQLFAVNFFGWQAGFQYYILVIALFPFLMPKGKWLLKSFLFILCLTAFIWLDVQYATLPQPALISHVFITFFNISNIIFSVSSMVISGAYFTLAMHETEDKLAAAEQKATLARLATDMAHEIQNPLNFVNNFSEANEELLTELDEELKKSSITPDARTLLNDLLDNSKRIKTNGKRVSAIVTALQEEVNREEKGE